MCTRHFFIHQEYFYQNLKRCLVVEFLLHPCLTLYLTGFKICIIDIGVTNSPRHTLFCDYFSLKFSLYLDLNPGRLTDDLSSAK